ERAWAAGTALRLLDTRQPRPTTSGPNVCNRPLRDVILIGNVAVCAALESVNLLDFTGRKSRVAMLLALGRSAMLISVICVFNSRCPAQMLRMDTTHMTIAAAMSGFNIW